MAATLSADEAPPSRGVDLKLRRHPVRLLVAQARRLSYLYLDQTRPLVAVADVTAARADAAWKEGALRENSVLLREVRRRIANSLQIIAGVLLRSARDKSDEICGHLQDAIVA